ncbi:hypothetical protein N7493_004720, partial [Penicillium malachiteum]
MCDVPFFPIFPICFQCGTDQNPCHCKVVGPTLGFCSTIVAAVICWPASIFCGCGCTQTGREYDSESLLDIFEWVVLIWFVIL